MSALGQKQTYAVQNGMSALPPIATSIAFFGMSALGQKRTLCCVRVTSASDQEMKGVGQDDRALSRGLRHRTSLWLREDPNRQRTGEGVRRRVRSAAFPPR